MRRTCALGYTEDEIVAMLPREDVGRFMVWFNGQTGAICTGGTERCPAAHGLVVYESDVAKWLAANLADEEPWVFD
jgi:hypothetical protein